MPQVRVHRRRNPPIGLELYSVRGELSKDLPKTLKTVAGYGYHGRGILLALL